MTQLFRYITCAVTVLVATATVHAQQRCCEFEGSFEAGAEALYWRASADSELFAVLLTDPTTDFFPLNAYQFRDQFEWGFGIFADYATCDRCQYIGAEWTHVHTSHTRHIAAPEGTGLAFPCPGDTVDDRASQAFGGKKVEYDAVDLEVGHRLIFCGCGNSSSLSRCCGLSAYLFASLRYLRIEDRYTAQLNFNPTTDVINTLRHCNRFSGGGPRFGLRFRSQICGHFGIVGKLALSSLIGSRQSSLTRDTLQTDQLTVLSDFGVDSDTMWAAQLDGKLGLDWCFSGGNYCQQHCGCDLQFRFEAGWAWEQLLTGLTSTGYEIQTTGPSTEGCVRAHNYDFGIGGLYLRASLGF